MLVRRIAADQQNCRRTGDVAQACGVALMSGQGSRKCDVVRRALVIDVVGLEHGASELLQQVIFFVGGVIRSDDTDGIATFAVSNLLEFRGGYSKRLFPACRFKFALCVTHERRALVSRHSRQNRIRNGPLRRGSRR